MISSGKKRGLATVAVSALAVTGVPFIASPASAAPSTATEIQTGYVGPARDGGTLGAAVLFKVKGLGLEGKSYPADLTEINAAMANLQVAGTDVTKPASDNVNQNVRIVGTPTWEQDGPNNRLGEDGYDEVTAFIAIDTPQAGDAFKFNAYFDNDEGHVDATGSPVDLTTEVPDVDLNEPRAIVEGTTAGAPTALEVSPASQVVPEDVQSGKYTLTLKDSAGRTTQLNTGDAINVTSDDTTNVDLTYMNLAAFPPASVTAATIDINAKSAPTGVATFTAVGDVKDLYTITATAGSATATAKLDVIGAASGISAAEVDIESGADSWDGFGGGSLGGTVNVRSDQSSITVKIASPSNAGKVVALSLTGTGDVKFGGGTTGSVSTTLDSNGNGSLTITPDAGTISNSGGITVAGSVAFTVNYDAAQFSMANVKPNATTYISAYGGSVDVTLTAVDQFGNPIAGEWLAVRRQGGVNGGAAGEAYSAKKQTDANGQVTFTLTDTKATAASHATDNVQVGQFNDQYDTTPAAGPTNKATIVYTADGSGGDFVIRADNTNTAASSYDPTSVVAVPLTDADADGEIDTNLDGNITDGTGGTPVEDAFNEIIDITADGGTSGAPMTVTVDNDALLLKGGTTLDKGVSTLETTVGSAVQLVGTKAGLVTVTVETGGVTKTAQVTVKALSNNAFTARNVAVSAPASAKSGELQTFGVKVTDAFGNAVAGYKVNDLNLQVSGPARLQDSDAVTGADGVLNVNVRLDDDANSPVTLQARATSTGNQFGAAANRLLASDTTNTAPGLTASVQTATGSIDQVTDLASLQAAVDAAQAKVNAAEAVLTAAQGELDVAKAERQVANKEVKAAKKAVKKAKKAVKKAPKAKKAAKRAQLRAAKKELRQARGDKKIAQTKVKAKNKVVKNAKSALAAAQAELEAAQQALEDAQSGEAQG